MIKQKDYKKQSFFFGFGIMLLILLPFAIQQGGLFTYYGDFTVQAIPFNMSNADFLKDFNSGWCWFNGLGSDFVQSFSYYTLGSPFFYLMALFPSHIIPYLFVPVIALKIGLACLFSYCFFKRYTKHTQSAFIAALLYSFSGWTFYNFIFYVFLDILIFFPLILIALDKLIYENKKFLLCVVVALTALDNFYFFIQVGIFVFIYFVVRTIFKAWPMTLKKFGLIFIECLIGVIMSSILFIPSIYATLSMPRTGTLLSGIGLILYPKPAFDYFKLISSFLFPAQTPGVDNVFLDNSSLGWGSATFFIPFFSLSGIICFIYANKKHWITKLIVLFSFFVFIPCLADLFNAENYQIYLRWGFMLIFFMALATVKALEENRELLTKSSLIVLIISLLCCGYLFFIKLEEFNLAVAIFKAFITILSLGVIFYFSKIDKDNIQKYLRNMTIGVVCSTLILGFITIWNGTIYIQDYGTKPVKEYVQYELKLPEEEKHSYRVTSAIGFHNLAMLSRHSSTEFFSTYMSRSFIDFYHYLDYSLGGPVSWEGNNSVITFLSNKYYVTCKMNKKPEHTINKNGDLLLDGYHYMGSDGFNRLYKNDNFVPYGFSYKYYYTQKDVSKLTKEEKSTLLLKGVLLDESQISKYSDVLKKYNVKKANLKYSLQQYKDDCSTLNNDLATRNFKATKEGFKCTYNSKQSNMIFFSIPYEDGWSAFIDGKRVEIDKVNKGFMAIKVAGGKHNIEFKYYNHLNHISVYISLFGVLMFAFYFLLGSGVLKKVFKNKKGETGYLSVVISLAISLMVGALVYGATIGIINGPVSKGLRGAFNKAEKDVSYIDYNDANEGEESTTAKSVAHVRTQQGNTYNLNFDPNNCAFTYSLSAMTCDSYTANDYTYFRSTDVSNSSSAVFTTKNNIAPGIYDVSIDTRTLTSGRAVFDVELADQTTTFDSNMTDNACETVSLFSNIVVAESEPLSIAFNATSAGGVYLVQLHLTPSDVPAENLGDLYFVNGSNFGGTPVVAGCDTSYLAGLSGGNWNSSDKIFGLKFDNNIFDLNPTRIEFDLRTTGAAFSADYACFSYSTPKDYQKSNLSSYANKVNCGSISVTTSGTKFSYDLTSNTYQDVTSDRYNMFWIANTTGNGSVTGIYCDSFKVYYSGGVLELNTRSLNS